VQKKLMGLGAISFDKAFSIRLAGKDWKDFQSCLIDFLEADQSHVAILCVHCGFYS
jgi:hypothetical protein